MHHDHPFPGSVPITAVSATIVHCETCGAVDMHIMCTYDDGSYQDVIASRTLRFGPFDNVDDVLEQSLPLLEVYVRSWAVPGLTPPTPNP